MSSESVHQLLGIAIFVVIAGLVLFFFDRPRPRAMLPQPPSDDEVRRFGRALDVELGGERRNSGDRSFQTISDERLEPLLDAFVQRAHEHGCQAYYDRHTDADGAAYRLEVRRPDHPAGQPLPYLSLSAGSSGKVSLLYGGVFPGPADHNHLDPEVGWREVAWADVDDELVAFARKVFARPH
ncbi:hypothetical protein [Phenylobacterium sp.]|uniref:hypothetical protein n=1 Tax=Phenylobacterium sp. TaxID=1871053 RepID=UPI0035B06C92